MSRARAPELVGRRGWHRTPEAQADGLRDRSRGLRNDAVDTVRQASTEPVESSRRQRSTSPQLRDLERAAHHGPDVLAGEVFRVVEASEGLGSPKNAAHSDPVASLDVWERPSEYGVALAVHPDDSRAVGFGLDDARAHGVDRQCQANASAHGLGHGRHPADGRRVLAVEALQVSAGRQQLRAAAHEAEQQREGQYDGQPSAPSQAAGQAITRQHRQGQQADGRVASGPVAAEPDARYQPPAKPD